MPSTKPRKRDRRAVDLTGQRFGWLTVIGWAGRSSCGHALWRCDCACGRTVVVRGHNLTRPTKATRSCGCDGRFAQPYPCGHPRSPENTTAGECRTCHRLRQARYRRAATANPPDELRLLFVPERRVRERRPIVIAPSVLAVIEASRAEYEAAIASKRPASRDSTDTAQGALGL